MRNACAIRKTGFDNKFILDKITPYENLYLELMECIEEQFFYTEYKNLGYVIEHLFDILTEVEKQVIRWRFGFDKKYYSLEEVGKELDLTRERIRQIEQNALSKLKLQAEVWRIEARYPVWDDYFLEKNIRNAVLKDKFINELKLHLDGKSNDISWLERIFQRNDIDIFFPFKDNLEEISLKSVGLEIREYSCLRRAGIDNLWQLIGMSEEDLSSIRNFGRKTTERTLGIIEQIKDSICYDDIWFYSSEDDTTNMTVMIKHGDETIRCCFENTNLDDLTKDIYKNLIEAEKTFGIIYDYGISFELALELMEMGVLFVRKIIEQKEYVIDKLCEKGLFDLIIELENFTLFIESYVKDVTYAPVTVIKLGNSIARQLINKKATSYEDVINCCETNDSRITRLYRRTINKYFRDSYLQNVIENIDEI